MKWWCNSDKLDWGKTLSWDEGYIATRRFRELVPRGNLLLDEEGGEKRCICVMEYWVPQK